MSDTVNADAGQIISECDLTNATRVAALVWMQAIDDRSSSSSITTRAGSNSSPCCALIISSAYAEGPFARPRRMAELKLRLDVRRISFFDALHAIVCSHGVCCWADRSLQHCVRFNPATGGLELVRTIWQ